METPQATTTSSELAQINISSSVFNFKVDFGEGLKITLDYDKQNDFIKRDVEVDLQILLNRQIQLDQHQGPRVGDYVIHKDGSYTRFTSDWAEDGLQAGGGSGSYHISKGGYCSYSGGLSDTIKLENLVETDEVKAGMVWFFSADWVGGSRSTHGYINFRVYKEI